MVGGLGRKRVWRARARRIWRNRETEEKKGTPFWEKEGNLKKRKSWAVKKTLFGNHLCSLKKVYVVFSCIYWNKAGAFPGQGSIFSGSLSHFPVFFLSFSAFSCHFPATFTLFRVRFSAIFSPRWRLTDASCRALEAPEKPAVAGFVGFIGGGTAWVGWN